MVDHITDQKNGNKMGSKSHVDRSHISKSLKYHSPVLVGAAAGSDDIQKKTWET